ncbi:hypothetical protein ACTFIY_001678 [Dictyostelium cf. discoideum]
MNESIKIVKITHETQFVSVELIIHGNKNKLEEISVGDISLFKFVIYFPTHDFTQSSINYIKISNSVTFMRTIQEFKASPLIKNIIFNPEFNNNLNQKMMKFPPTLETICKEKLNDSQLNAIKSSLVESGVTLIQGPPGTGKTTTINYLLSVLLAIDQKFKILVCGPSHASVDEVAKRCLKNLLNSSGQIYKPNMVRIGRKEKISPECQKISLKNKNSSKRINLIKSASIVFSTLAGTGSNAIKENFSPDIVLIDESTQSSEPTSVIPLSLGSIKKLILVGDPVQLPPTIFSRDGADCGLKISLFERLAKSIDVHFLNTQYRMHPVTSKFISEEFYNGTLKDGENVSIDSYGNCKFHSDPSFGPMKFFDLPKSNQIVIKKSMMNQDEIDMVFTLIKELIEKYPECKKLSFGIITPYKLQMNEIKEQLIRSEHRYLDISVSTIDGVQGSEKDIIIMSCVRSIEKFGIGFLSDRRRINVALTRAKLGLYVIGTYKVLTKDNTWEKFLLHTTIDFSQIYKSNHINNNSNQSIQNSDQNSKDDHDDNNDDSDNDSDDEESEDEFFIVPKGGNDEEDDDDDEMDNNDDDDEMGNNDQRK